MRRTPLFLWLTGLLLFVGVPAVDAFFDELEALKAEMVVWETTHAADFSDLMNTLDDLSGRTFEDVVDSDWFSPYVASVSDWGIVSGYRNDKGELIGKFGPANSVTVAEMLKMAFEAAQVDETGCTTAPVLAGAATHWAALYVSCGEERNMRILREPGLDLNRPAERAEVLSIIHDAFGDTVPPLYSNFKDTQGHRFEADIAFAYSAGLITGDKDSKGVALGTFRPNALINRAETAKIIYERLKAQVKAAA